MTRKYIALKQVQFFENSIVNSSRLKFVFVNNDLASWQYRRNFIALRVLISSTRDTKRKLTDNAQQIFLLTRPVACPHHVSQLTSWLKRQLTVWLLSLWRHRQLTAVLVVTSSAGCCPLGDNVSWLLSSWRHRQLTAVLVVTTSADCCPRGDNIYKLLTADFLSQWWLQQVTAVIDLTISA